MADRGELGPLDAQLRQEDELFQWRSGLTVLSALSTLHEQAFDAYWHFLLQTKLRTRGSITTKTAIQVATGLAGDLFGRVYDHIDAMHVGEAGRFLKIAHQYGQVLERTGGNCKPGTLDRLTTQYPSHSFIIDRVQAEDLFRKVRPPSPSEAELVRQLGEEALRPRGEDREPLLTFLDVAEPAAEEQQGHGESSEERVARTTAPDNSHHPGGDESSAPEDPARRLVEVGRTEG